MDKLFDVKHGITIRGKDYGFVGISTDDIDTRVDDMLLFVESFSGSAGGTIGEELETCVDFPHETLTLEKFTDFETKFRERYPTFDGHFYLHDINHFTADESKILDSMDYDDIADDIDDEVEDGDEWKYADE
jgi:hypothetical protein